MFDSSLNYKLSLKFAYLIVECLQGQPCSTQTPSFNKPVDKAIENILRKG